MVTGKPNIRVIIFIHNSPPFIVDEAHICYKKLIPNFKHKKSSVLKSITAREIEILTLIGSGMTVNEISEKLNISTHTVDSHKKNISKKLGFKTASQMVRFALETGLV